MSVTVDEIVARGLIACGIQETQAAGNTVLAETPDDLFPYFLTTGRILMHY